MIKKHIYLVRHGESEENFKRLILGKDSMLTQKGIGQAQVVAERIKRIGVEAVVSSTWPRAIQTAEIIADVVQLPLETSPHFVEAREAGSLKGKPYDAPEVFEVNKKIFEGYLKKEHRIDDEENVEDLGARALAALTFLENHPKDRICVVSHARFLRALFVSMWFGGAFSGAGYQQALKTLGINNTSVTHAIYEPEPPHESSLGTVRHSWRVVSWNDSAHLG